MENHYDACFSVRTGFCACIDAVDYLLSVGKYRYILYLINPKTDVIKKLVLLKRDDIPKAREEIKEFYNCTGASDFSSSS